MLIFSTNSSWSSCVCEVIRGQNSVFLLRRAASTPAAKVFSEYAASAIGGGINLASLVVLGGETQH